MNSEAAREEYRRASTRWHDALVASAQAPPDAGFPERLREVAVAANQQSAAFERLAAPESLRERSRGDLEVIEERGDRPCLLDRREVLTDHVLDQRELERLTAVDPVLDEGGDRCAPAIRAARHLRSPAMRS
jgi:hypothetical protein